MPDHRATQCRQQTPRRTEAGAKQPTGEEQRAALTAREPFVSAQKALPSLAFAVSQPSRSSAGRDGSFEIQPFRNGHDDSTIVEPMPETQ